MQLHAVTQLNVEREMENVTAPLPEDLLNAAIAEPEKPRYVSASSYADTVHALRAKGFTWNEVTEWMNGHGANFSMQSIIGGYRHYYRQGDGSLPDIPWEQVRAELTAAGKLG